jgi:soluble cytochrome b562
MNVEQALKSYENDKFFQQDILKYQQELRIADLSKQIDLSKEESRNEVIKTRQESDKAILELKLLYENEIENLKSQLRNTQDKLRSEKNKRESFRSENNPKMMEIRIEELESELDFYKSRVKRREENSMFNSQEEGRKNRDLVVESLALENEKVKVQLERSRFEVEQISMQLERNRREQMENENNLKNEIKFLIGKLLKAKSKLNAESELSETVRKDQILTGLKFKSFNKSRASLRSSDKYTDCF